MIECGTDKATVFTRTYAKPKGYSLHYEEVFERIRNRPIKLLEIGTGGGESIRSWLLYFPLAQVFSIDNQQSTNDWNTVGRTLDPRYVFTYGDQTDTTFWKCFAVDCGKDWDIIIDDGAHTNDTTIISFNGLWPLLKSGGIYCIEDLATAYGGDPFFSKPGFPNQIDWLNRKVDEMNKGSGNVDSIYFSKELAILRKK